MCGFLTGRGDLGYVFFEICKIVILFFFQDYFIFNYVWICICECVSLETKGVGFPLELELVNLTPGHCKECTLTNRVASSPILDSVEQYFTVTVPSPPSPPQRFSDYLHFK